MRQVAFENIRSHLKISGRMLRNCQKVLRLNLPKGRQSVAFGKYLLSIALARAWSFSGFLIQ